MTLVPVFAQDSAAWLDAFGRLHPFVLHLPIGLLVAVALLELLAFRRAPLRAAIGPLLTLAAVSALLTAASGWRLAAEHQDSELLERHRLCGLALAGTSVLAALLFRLARSGRATWTWLYRIALLAALTVLVLAGHYGGSLTHGEGFLLEPLQADAEPPAAAASRPAASTYELVVAPIFAARCTSCHSATRHKGGLVLQTADGIRAGGKSGPALAPGAPERSRILERMSLPLDHKQHMPPSTRPQPAAGERELLQRWLAAGAPFTGFVAGLEPLVAAPPAAPAAARAALQAELVHVQELARDSTLLAIDFGARARELEPARIAQLLAPIVAQVADLKLARTRAGDEMMVLVAAMPHLRRLDLSETRVTSTGLAALRDHPRLATLIVVATGLDGDAVPTLLAMPALRSLFAWNAGLPEASLAALRARLTVDDGNAPDAEVLEREDAVLLSSDAPPPGAAASSSPANALCPVTGNPIDLRFVVVDLGRAVGFCCADCAAKFWSEPEKYRAKLR